tara:strand:+ start:273 stop:863 length:591 start_codon:yes stop_codon:yes gene_type:complete
MTTDIELIEKVKEDNCEDSLKTLIQRHAPLCFDICKKYAPAMVNRGLNTDDITDDKEFLIYKSVLSFNPDKKAKFSTWLGNQVRYHCLNCMNKNRLIPTEDAQMDYFINRDVEYVKDPIEDQVDYVVNLIKQIKDERVGRVIQVRYFENPNKKTPWSKVADKVGVSTQTAINLHNKAIKIIRRKIRNKNLFSTDKI